MKRAVSISIGSSKRNKTVEVELLGEKVLIERIGTDGSMEKAAQLYRELDGKVNAFGVGGNGPSDALRASMRGFRNFSQISLELTFAQAALSR